MGVPVISPVAAAMDSPEGSPEADQVMVVPDDESVAVLARAVMAEPDGLDWLPGSVTDTAPVTVQVKLAEPLKAELSVTVMVIGKTPAVVRVPVINPVPELTTKPAGSPVAA